MLTVARGSRASDDLDMIRGLAALGVFLGHARNLFFVDYPEVAQKSFWVQGFYFLTSLGHQWVMVFFVLSGFFIGSSVLKDIQRKRWSWGKYLVNRGTRLYIVLLPALLLTIVCDSAGMRLSGNDSIYQGCGGQNVVPNISDRMSPGVFLGNGLFLQTILVPTFGSNGPLWSLSNEFWYYVLFPCLCVLLAPGSSRWRKAILSLAAVLIVCNTLNLMLLFPVWLLGALLVMLPRSSLFDRPGTRMVCLSLSILAFLASLFGARVGYFHNELLSDYCVGVTFAIVIYLQLHRTGVSREGWYSQAATRLAGMSYTLYLTHLPMLVLLFVILKLPSRWQPGFFHLLMVAGVCLAVFGYSWLVWKITEAKTDSVRKWVAGLLLPLPGKAIIMDREQPIVGTACDSVTKP